MAIADSPIPVHCVIQIDNVDGVEIASSSSLLEDLESVSYTCTDDSASSDQYNRKQALMLGLENESELQILEITDSKNDSVGNLLKDFTCSTCMEKLIKELSCGHKLCTTCDSNWMDDGDRRCPICAHKSAHQLHYEWAIRNYLMQTPSKLFNEQDQTTLTPGNKSTASYPTETWARRNEDCVDDYFYTCISFLSYVIPMLIIGVGIYMLF